ncbi:MAG: glutathione S-transferase family protein [Leptospiraceae bacterium]|nr:glutathione S-transferase family protein [Leptospiraceae bacterium]
MSIKLVSFKLCPFVHRAATLLQHNQSAYEISYIDLENKPDWFLEISPLGKVPVLCVNGDPLFESIAILEYLDETASHSLHPADPFRKARNRAFVGIIDSLFGANYRLSRAADEAATRAVVEDIQKVFLLLEKEQPGPFFNGAELAFLDVVAAPFFYRLELIRDRLPGIYAPTPAVERWSTNLAQLEAVKAGVVGDFSDLYQNYLAKNQAWISTNTLAAG